MKTLIIDDEAASRTLIREYLSPYKEVHITGECINGIDAVSRINEEEPELIFLDI